MTVAYFFGPRCRPNYHRLLFCFAVTFYLAMYVNIFLPFGRIFIFKKMTSSDDDKSFDIPNLKI